MLNPETQRVVRTAADELFEEGLKQGLERGRLSGRRELLLRMITLKFGGVPQAAHAAVETADLATLEAMAERILSAQSVTQVLAPD